MQSSFTQCNPQHVWHVGYFPFQPHSPNELCSWDLHDWSRNRTHHKMGQMHTAYVNTEGILDFPFLRTTEEIWDFPWGKLQRKSGTFHGANYRGNLGLSKGQTTEGILDFPRGKLQRESWTFHGTNYRGNLGLSISVCYRGNLGLSIWVHYRGNLGLSICVHYRGNLGLSICVHYRGNLGLSMRRTTDRILDFHFGCSVSEATQAFPGYKYHTNTVSTTRLHNRIGSDLILLVCL